MSTPSPPVSSLGLKVVFEASDVRRFAFPLTAGADNFSRLLSLLRESFRLGCDAGLVCRYEDDERDMVLLTSEPELAEAIRQITASAKAKANTAAPTLKLFVNRRTDATPSFASPAPSIATITATAAAAPVTPAPTPTPTPAPAPVVTPLIATPPLTTATTTVAAAAATTTVAAAAAVPTAVATITTTPVTSALPIEAPAPVVVAATPAPAPTPAPVPVSPAPAVVESVAPYDASRPIVHVDTTCSVCKMSPIAGTRFQCTACVAFDMCERCEESDAHPAAHIRIRARVPLECSPLCQNPCPADCPITKAHRSYHERVKAEAAAAAAVAWAPDSSFVADITIPDDSVHAPNTRLIKTWSVKNIGAASWPAATVLQYQSGTLKPTAESEIVTPIAVSGETVNVSVPFVTPSTAGEHTGTYQLYDSVRKECFGASFWVSIRVAAPEPTPVAAPTPVATAAPVVAVAATPTVAAALTTDAAPAAVATPIVTPVATPVVAATPALDVKSATPPHSVLRQSSMPEPIASSANAVSSSGAAVASSSAASAKPESKKPVSLAPYLSKASREEEERRQALMARSTYDGPYRKELDQLRLMGFKKTDDELLSWIMLSVDAKANKNSKTFNVVDWVVGELLKADTNSHHDVYQAARDEDNAERASKGNYKKRGKSGHWTFQYQK